MSTSCLSWSIAVEPSFEKLLRIYWSLTFLGLSIPPVCLTFQLTRTPSQVKEARRLRTIRIVKLEWLEDSLMSKSRRPLDTIKYEYEQRKIQKKPRVHENKRKHERATHDSSEDSDARVSGVSSRKEKMRKLKMKKQQSLGVEPFSKGEKMEISGKTLPLIESPCLQKYGEKLTVCS
jgi:hypothetical protein